MVKSIISIIISVLILVAGALYEQTVVLKQFNEFETTVTDLIKKSEDKNITVDEVKNIQVDWRNKKRFLHIFIPHNEIKEVELWISEAISFAEYENYEELTDKLKVLKDLSKEIPKTFLIRPDNIL